MLVPLVRLLCAIKASAAKGRANPTREHGNGGRDGASAGAAGAVSARNKGFRSQRLRQTHMPSRCRLSAVC